LRYFLISKQLFEKEIWKLKEYYLAFNSLLSQYRINSAPSIAITRSIIIRIDVVGIEEDLTQT
jgi:hypothetical protein